MENEFVYVDSVKVWVSRNNESIEAFFLIQANHIFEKVILGRRKVGWFPSLIHSISAMFVLLSAAEHCH